ncbi:MAG: hypothetical protein B1H03_05755 [Planctomycetales bacterium 4484_113]|nr:MAG: hypothetical protein B1H03_05755 [Planctomycetales bacterium 4484_113]
MNETRKPDAESAGVSKQELDLFKEESLRAIESVKARLRRGRIARSALSWGAAGAVVILVAAFFLPRLLSTSTVAPLRTQQPKAEIIARLVVPKAADDAIQVLKSPAGEEAGAEAEPLVPINLPIEPIVNLRAGDSITIADGAYGIFYDLKNRQRLKCFGCCRLQITYEGAVPVGLVKREPQIADTGFWAMNLPPQNAGVMRASAGKLPLPIFPVDTSVPPGKVNLRWDYSGDAKTLELTVENEAGEVLLKKQLDGSTRNYEIIVHAGRPYYWRIGVPDAEIPIAQEFHVLREAQWQWVQEAAAACGITGDDLLRGVGTLKDVERLSALYDIFTGNDLHREAEAARLRMQEILASSE